MKRPGNWHVHHSRDPERESRNLQRRFQTILRQNTPTPQRRYTGVWPLTIIVTAVLYLVLAPFLPWLPSVAFETGPYYQNCDAARAAGVAPIYRGQPGYRSPLDRDNDGIACEPLRR